MSISQIIDKRKFIISIEFTNLIFKFFIFTNLQIFQREIIVFISLINLSYNFFINIFHF